jgi:hypothetical protein
MSDHSHRMHTPTQPELAELTIADAPDLWRELGFEVASDDLLDVGGVRVHLGGDGEGITSWSLRPVSTLGAIDGLPTPAPSTLRPPPFATHPNGVTGIDHVVVFTPDFDRTASALAQAEVPLKRTDTLERYGHVGFRRLGPSILQLAHRPELGDGPARFWGLTFVVISLDSLAERLGDRLGKVRPAEQGGRRIAVLSDTVGISTMVAFISPELP